MHLITLFIFLVSLSLNLFAYESENRLQTVIIGKVAKYIEWRNNERDFFTITVLDNQFGTLFDEIYKNKQIKNKKVKIKYIQNIDQLQSTDILFISKANRHNIDTILEQLKSRKILTISNVAGFAQKGGCIQLYFFEQKLKIKMNIECINEKELNVSNTLLRVVEIVKRIDNE